MPIFNVLSPGVSQHRWSGKSGRHLRNGGGYFGNPLRSSSGGYSKNSFIFRNISPSLSWVGSFFKGAGPFGGQTAPSRERSLFNGCSFSIEQEASKSGESSWGSVEGKLSVSEPGNKSLLSSVVSSESSNRFCDAGRSCDASRSCDVSKSCDASDSCGESWTAKLSGELSENRFSELVVATIFVARGMNARKRMMTVRKNTMEERLSWWKKSRI